MVWKASNFGVVTIGAAWLICGALSADEAKPEAKPQVKATLKSPARISPEREAAIREFVKNNHAELMPLLEGLKDVAPAEYNLALTDLEKTVDRLEKIKAKTPARYDAQLADWKLTSRIRLLAARVVVQKNSASAESDLRAAVVERFETRLANQRAEAEQLQKRLDKLNAAIAQSTSKKDELIENEIKQLKAPRPAVNAADAKKAKQPSAAPVESKAGVQP